MLSPVRSLWVNEFETLRPRKNPLSLTSLRPASGPTYSRVSLARALYHSCSVSKRGVFACRPEPLNLSYLGSQSQSLVSSHRRDYYMLFGGGHERGNHLDSIIARLSDIRTKLALLAVAVLGGELAPCLADSGCCETKKCRWLLCVLSGTYTRDWAMAFHRCIERGRIRSMLRLKHRIQ